MYLPKHFAEHDLTILHELVERYSFGALVVAVPGAPPEVTHLPFLLDRARGPRGSLLAHVARANPIWRAFDGAREAVAIFQGPHGYVSPSWYESREDVPTWNYAVVHAHGAPRVLDSGPELVSLLGRLTDAHERGRPDAWSIDEVPAASLAELSRAIVGFEMEIGRLEGKLKLSQNRRPADREGAIRGLRERGSPDDLELVRLMTRVT